MPFSDLLCMYERKQLTAGCQSLRTRGTAVATTFYYYYYIIIINDYY